MPDSTGSLASEYKEPRAPVPLVCVADGSRFVCHINSGGDQGRQRDMADRGDSPVAGDVGRRLFEPGAYRRRANNIYTQATTFGIRSPNGWRFYSQVNEFNSQARTIRFLRVDTI